MPLQLLNVVGGPPVDPDKVTIFEAALSTATADTIGVRLGDRLQVSVDRSDSVLARGFGTIAPTEIEVVGLFEPLDPDAGDWANSGLIQPAVRQGVGGIEAIYAAAYVAADEYPSLSASGFVEFRYDWRYVIDAERLDAGQVDALLSDLRRLDLLTPAEDDRDLPDVGAVARLRQISVARGLLVVLEEFADQRLRAETVLSMAAIGPLGLALSAMAMLAILLVQRRRDSLLLARGRGTSGRLLLGAQAIEAVLLAGGAALVGLTLAAYAVPARDTPLSVILAFGIAGAASLLLLAATWPTARRPLLTLERDDVPVLRVPPRRLVFEATIVAVCLLALYLLQQRGLGAVGNGLTFDPLLAAVPLLTGLAAGIVALRLYPIAVRAVGWLAARRRDLVPVVGLRTVARHPAAWNLPVLVLMLTAAFGSFASVIGSTVERGQVGASYLDVGADYRLERVGIGALPTAIEPAALPGAEAVATGVSLPTAFVVRQDSTRRSTIEVAAIDAFAYARVTADTTAEPNWPAGFLEPPGGDAGGPDNPIPAFASDQFLQGNQIDPGDTFMVSVGREPLTLRLVGSRSGLPGLGSASFVLVPVDWLRAALPETTLGATVMWVRGPSELAAPLAQMVNGPATRVRIVAREDVYQALHDAPLGTAVADGFKLALGVGVLYMTVTLIGAVVISATRQKRDLSYLRALGVSRRGVLAVTIIEQAPPLLLGLIPGFLLGIGVARVVEPGLGLHVFIGARGLPLEVDWAALALVVAGVTAVVVLAIGLGAWLSGRNRPASALRMGDS
jgi:putative ABC transport system permease protein